MTIPPHCVDCGGPVLGEAVVVVYGDNATGARAHGYAHPAGSPDCARALPTGAGGRHRLTGGRAEPPQRW